VTYVSRGLESVRGFDIFVRVAKRIYEQRTDVLFVVVGAKRTHYGHEAATIGKDSFFLHVLSSEGFDLSRFRWLGTITPLQLVDLFSISDLHIYLTAPWVLSWSLLNAMACQCTILASDTPPVAEVIESGQNGVLAGFYDVEDLAEKALTLLKYPHPALRRAARATILESYELTHCVQKLKKLFLGETSCP